MAIQALLTALLVVGIVQAGLVKRVSCPGTTHTAINAACCNWFAVRDDIMANLLGGDCGEEVHESLRLTFHDAIGFSPQLRSQGKFPGGGADGSIIAFSDIEQTFAANLGTEDMADTQKGFADAHGVSYGDMIQFTGAVAISLCAGAPQITFMAGRPNATGASPPSMLPDPFDPITKILARMGDAGFTPKEVVALIASHTTAAQDHVDASVHGSPMDSTFDTFDNQLFIEVQLRGTGFPGTGGNQGETQSPLPGEVRLLSDHLLARDSATSCFWQALAADRALMKTEFQAAMSKLAVLGQDVSKLVDCTEVIPIAASIAFEPHFPAGKTHADVEQACATAAFPNFPTLPGPIASVAPVPA